MDDIGVLPVCAGNKKRMFCRKASGQPAICLYQPDVVLAWMLDPRNVQYSGTDSFRTSLLGERLYGIAKSVVEHSDILIMAFPESHHVCLCCSADGHKLLRAFGKERQNSRQIKHPHAGVFAWNVEVGQVMHRRRCADRIPCTNAAICCAYHETVEIAAMALYEERQNKKVPNHA